MTIQDQERVAKFLRVKVVDRTKEGRPAVNIKVPIGVVERGMKMAASAIRSPRTPLARDGA